MTAEPPAASIPPRRCPARPIRGPRTGTPSRRAGPPYHMTDMIAAEPALALRLLERLVGPRPGRRAGGGHPGDARRGRARSS